MKPKNGEIFVDLGSGTGKAVLAASCGFPEFSEVWLPVFDRQQYFVFGYRGCSVACLPEVCAMIPKGDEQPKRVDGTTAG